MVDGHVVLGAFHAGQQLGGIDSDKGGAYVHFLGQQLTQLHFKTGEFVAFLEVEGRGVGFHCDAQFPAVKYIVDQFGMGQGTCKGQ